VGVLRAEVAAQAGVGAAVDVFHELLHANHQGLKHPRSQIDEVWLGKELGVELGQAHAVLPNPVIYRQGDFARRARARGEVA
jgi:hypothetical protein